MSSVPIYLDVPFKEKDHAKAFGALWDRERRAWFIPTGLDISRFEHWLPRVVDGGIANNVLLVPETCWKCRDTTMCLLAGADADTYYFLGEESFQCLASQLDANALIAIGAGPLRPRWSGTLGRSSWSNGCVHCDVLRAISRYGSFSSSSPPMTLSVSFPPLASLGCRTRRLAVSLAEARSLASTSRPHRREIRTSVLLAKEWNASMRDADPVSQTDVLWS